MWTKENTWKPVFLKWTAPWYFIDKKIPGIAFSVRNRKASGKTKYFGEIKAGCFFLRL